MTRKILFRMDDICPQMNHERFERMRAIFEKYEVKPVIGVVPECKDPFLFRSEEDPQFWEKIRSLQEQGWTVAMHGCFHQYVTKNNGYLSHGHASEFAGLPYEEQLEKLQYGQEKLRSHGIKTDLFMAPSHSYDKNTLRALHTLGFRYVTDGLTARPYIHMGLLFVPCIESKITKVKRFSTVCYHTNDSKERIFPDTETLLKTARNIVISFEEAKELPRMPYWIARMEEYIRYFYKNYIRLSVYRIWCALKALKSTRTGTKTD